MSRDSRPPLPGCTQPSFLRAEWETGDRLSPRDSVGDSKERGLCNETSSRRTRRLEGLAEARGSWKGQERGAGDLFSLAPWLPVCFSELGLDALKVRGFLTSIASSG